MPACSLCANPLNELELADEFELSFRTCPRCGLLERDSRAHLSLEAERAFYGTHQNHMEDLGYRAFLARLAEPLAARLRPGARGLDFGCGPAPLLALLMNQAGFGTAWYDPLFASDESLLALEYEFVSCSEVVEHFRNPAESWSTLFSLLRSGGVLGVMTEWYRGQRPLSSWRYARDPTHVVFYQRETFHYLAAKHGAHVEFPRPNVCLFTV